ncbi:PCC domain-containing protein [Ideonella oryzae]|uniref:DUF296 domain-containing protein n=1 Tax=Ideonella oryzae TaxID=2937441 RepID=A0ABT1BNK6_9BURK|nr:DUF296 domain-containing protein [Ideonella oryzae]MCO5977007.1 DUF296 domain-containing protein [Ideonella oryzae]
MPERFAALPRPRTLVHPGPFRASRIDAMHAPHGRHFRLSVGSGPSLYEALVEGLAAHQVTSASMTLIGGRFDLLTFCFAGEDRSGQALVRYSAPMVTESAQFVFGNATLGKTAAGRPIVHCHAVFRGGDGRMLGGHLLTERCRVGTAPMTVLATSLEGFELRVDVDAETRTPLLHPLSATVSEVAHV